MEPQSDEEHKLSTPTAGSPKALPVAPDRPVRPILHASRMIDGHGTVCKQPVFDSSEDEDVLLHAPTTTRKGRLMHCKDAPTTRKKARLMHCKEDKVAGLAFDLSEQNLTVLHYPLNRCDDHSNKSCTRVPVREFCEGDPTSDFNVSESSKKDRSRSTIAPDGLFEPGVNELEGLVVAAHEIADRLADHQTAVIISSKHGGDATKLLFTCAAAVYKNKHKQSPVDGHPPKMRVGAFGDIVKQIHTLPTLPQADMAAKLRILCNTASREVDDKWPL